MFSIFHSGGKCGGCGDYSDFSRLINDPDRNYYY